MSGSFATNRPSGGAEEFERRRRSLLAGPDTQLDPLAELARLVGQNDPFRGAQPQIRPTIPPSERVEPSLGTPAPHFEPRNSYAEVDDDFRGALDVGEEPGAPDDPAVVHAAFDRAGTPAPVRAERPAPATRDQRAPEVSADHWARGIPPAAGPGDQQGSAATSDEPMSANGSSKRTLIVLAAVVALTGGGLAASFLAKPSTSAMVASSSAATPTILAATGPSKVQPEAQAADAGGQSEPSTLLDKNKSDGTATAKVVNSVEQPVDLNQAVKPAAAPTGDDASSSPFPEPRKVKTILVRPDGTIIADVPPKAAAPETSSDQPASLAFDPRTSLPVLASQPAPDAAPPPAAPEAAMPVAAPATPPAAAGKSQARVAVTPRAAAPTDDTVTQGRAAGVTPKAKPPAAAKVAPKPAPTQEADATPTADTATASLPSGTFAAQLGAGGSEAEARDLSSRLSKKFADAVGGRLSVHKAQSGTKTVYRVRVSGLSQDAAKTLCAKVTSGGGGCFVARD